MGIVEAQSEEGVLTRLGAVLAQIACAKTCPLVPEKGVGQWCPDASVGREAGPPNTFEPILPLLLFIPCLCNFLII